jgi:hypothetical protein
LAAASGSLFLGQPLLDGASLVNQLVFVTEQQPAADGVGWV